MCEDGNIVSRLKDGALSLERRGCVDVFQRGGGEGYGALMAPGCVPHLLQM